MGYRLGKQHLDNHKITQCSDCYLCYGSRGSLTLHRRNCTGRAEDDEEDEEEQPQAMNIDVNELHELFKVGSQPARAPQKSIIVMTEAEASKLIYHLLNNHEDAETEQLSTLAFSISPFIVKSKNKLKIIREALNAI